MLDIVKFCKAHRIPLAGPGDKHTGPGWQNLDCPFCGDRQDWHLGYSLEWGNFNCWKCGPKSVRQVIGRLLKTSDLNAIIREIARFQIEGGKERREKVERKPDIKPPPGTGPMARRHRTYLQSRGFGPEQLETDWGLLGTQHLSAEWNWRVIIPVADRTGRVVAYQGRSILADAEPKYRFTPNRDILVEPETMLYGIQKAEDAAIVVEGVTGVWRLGLGCVATFGIKWHVEQAEQLRHMKRRYILFDPEPEAQRQATKLAEWLSMFPGVTEVVSGFRTDPGDFTPELASEVKRNLGFGG